MFQKILSRKVKTGRHGGTCLESQHPKGLRQEDHKAKPNLGNLSRPWLKILRGGVIAQCEGARFSPPGFKDLQYWGGLSLRRKEMNHNLQNERKFINHIMAKLFLSMYNIHVKSSNDIKTIKYKSEQKGLQFSSVA